MKYSTIGTNWITELFIETTKQTGEAELNSVYSRSEEKAEAFAKKNGAKNWFTDLDEMLNGPADFVYVASPNSFHYEHAMKCIEKGKHVFCEKPMVYTEEQLTNIQRQAEKFGVFVFEGYRHLFSPNYQTLKTTLADIGQLRSVLLQYVQYSSRYDDFKAGNTPNVFSKEFAGGALMDLGVYPLSAAIDLFGEPVAAKYFPVMLSSGVDGSGTLVLTYDDFIVTIICSKTSQATIPSEIHGEQGTLTMDHISPITSLSIYDHRTNEKEELAKPIEKLDMVYQLTEFIKMIEEKDTTSHDKWLERSRRVAKWSAIARKEAGIVFPND